MIQFIIPAVVGGLGGILGHQVGKSGEKSDNAERIGAIKELAGLSPDQARAVDALSAQPIEEVRIRRELGIGPLSPLPANASARAQEIRNNRIAAAAAAGVAKAK